jgi:hypothetical protein
MWSAIVTGTTSVGVGETEVFPGIARMSGTQIRRDDQLACRMSRGRKGGPVVGRSRQSSGAGKPLDVSRIHAAALASPIKLAAGGNLLFDLDVCTVDIVQMLELAYRFESIEGLLSPRTVAQVSAALAAANGEFLPDWEDLEQSVTAGRGTAGEAVRELRRRVQGAKVVLLAGLGDHYLAARDPSELFDEAIALRPERPDLARTLAAALDASGQPGRADEIRHSYLEGRSASS